MRKDIRRIVKIYLNKPSNIDLVLSTERIIFIPKVPKKWSELSNCRPKNVLIEF